MLEEQEKILDLRKKFLEWKSLRNEWNEETAYLKADFDAGNFLGDAGIVAVMDKLSKISRIQREITERYQTLHLEKKWKTAEEAEKLLEEYQKLLERKQKYDAAIQLFLCLKSDIPDIAGKLAKIQEELSSKRIEELSEEQCQNEFEKYVLFMETLEETVPDRRHQLAMQLMREFDSSVVMGLVAGWIFCDREETKSQDEAAELQGTVETDKITEVPEIEELGKAAEVQETAQFDEAAELQETTESDEIAEAQETVESAQVAEICESAESDSTAKANEISEPEEPVWNQAEAECSATSEAGDAAQNDLSQDNAVQKDSNQENSRKESLEKTVVLGADTSTVYMNHKAESEEEEENPERIWENLDGAELKEMLVPEDRSKLDVTSSNKLKFGFKEFKNDMVKMNLFFPRKALQACYNFNGITPNLLAQLCDKTTIECTNMCERLLQMGYFDKYWVVGYGEFYALSIKGEKAFQNQKACELLKMKGNLKEDDKERIENTTNAALARILHFESFERILDINPAYQMEQSQIFGRDYCVTVFRHLTEQKAIGAVSIVSEEPKQYAEFLEVVGRRWRLLDVLLILGLNEQHARAVSDWLSEKASGLKNGITAKIWYCYCGERAIFDSHTGEEIDLGTWDISEKESEKEEKDEPEKNVQIDEAAEAQKMAEPDETANVQNGETQEETGKAEEIVAEESAVEKSTIEESAEEVTKKESAEEKSAEKQTVEKHAAEETTGKILSDRRMSSQELTEEQQRAYDEICQEMICSGRVYCAAAYLKALALQYAPYKNKYQQFAYAVNDPIEKCSYNSDTILNMYFSHTAEVPAQYAVAATLRNFFLDQYSYDYSMRDLYGTISNNEVLSSDGTLSRIVYKLFLFKSDYGAGIDRYADYRTKEREVWARRLEAVRSEARSYYDNNVLGQQKENVSNRRLLETRKLIFARDGYIGEFLEAVVKDDHSSLKDMEDFLREYYIKENAGIDETNIDQTKVEQAIEESWEEAAKSMRLTKKSSDLMGRLRTNLVSAVKKAVGVLCKYVSLQKSVVSDETDAGSRGYRKEHAVLLSDIKEVIGRLEQTETEKPLEERAADQILLLTLKELAARLDGTYNELSNTYFYLGFLKNDKILLDEACLPVLEDVPELPEFSVLNRIEQHAKEPEQDLRERFQDIFNGADDYGSAKLILQYLQDVGEEVPEEMAEHDIAKEAAGYPFEGMKDRKIGFLEDLELAQSNGQFDETGIEQKESILQSMEAWYEWAKETQNYGFFEKILSAFKQKIREDARTRAEQMKRTLQVNLEKHPKWMEEEKTRAVVAEIQKRIQSQNYVAAEDLLNRLIAEDIDSDGEGGQTDYLEEFLSEYEFYKNKTANTGFSLEKLMTGSIRNKDARGASRLLDFWPKGNPAGEDRVRNLLEALGFCTESVKAQDRAQNKIDMYQVSLKKPQNGKKNNYKHPIAAFGSEAEVKPFRVVCLYGRMDAGRLIDTFKEIGNAKHTLVFLDFALTLRDRRELARKTKTELDGKVFAVIDRVVIAYLVNHYTETAINRILMSVIMPFASYQPYIEDSASVMPQEIFMGRKSELAKIEDPTGVNIVYGGRQLGKSALLRMAQKEIDKDENKDRAVVIDIKDLNYKQAAVRVSRELLDVGILQEEETDDWGELARNIKNRLRQEDDFIPYLLLMMDEADAFVESCEEVNYQPLDALKDIQSVGTGRFKFVIAGLRNVVRFDQNKSLKNNSVLTHLGHLTIKPFRSMEARELLMVPLSYLGFRFPKDRDTEILISTILGTTNYFPGMIQLYCKKLIETMQRDYAGYSESETPPYVVRKEHIKKVLSEKGLLDTIREKFFITLKVDNDNYYHIIALLVAYHYQKNRDQNGCSAWDVIELAGDLGISQIADMDEKKVVALMEELRELNVFQYNGEERYRFTRLSFCQNMGTISQIEDELLSYME
ncbi:MAG: hypothetical protein Q4E24_15960 [bacterium]|nr:hypothetical protein [bacterium]